ncbi:MAG: hypothetical protein K2M19_01095 [Muribaculaceae bacterium]|nr:hypothetical protein [Muribaculaceae bacterium]
MRQLFFSIFIFCTVAAAGCTAAIVPAECSASGRPMIWKHRDTGADNNFIAHVAPAVDGHGYTALFNASDSLMQEAWMGFNDVGFAIINTASYNLMPDTATVRDREGFVMSQALAQCTTVDDFERLIEYDFVRRGVQANFGVIDARGGAAWFETSDNDFNRFDVRDSVVVRTNFSYSGNMGDRLPGLVRYHSARHLLGEMPAKLRPIDFTEGLSRSFYHSALGRDCKDDSVVTNRDFIPRDISTASLVIEGVSPVTGEGQPRMWGCLGYPAVAVGQWITAESIPAGMRRGADGRSSDCTESFTLMHSATLPNCGADYLRMDILRPLIWRAARKSLVNFNSGL